MDQDDKRNTQGYPRVAVSQRLRRALRQVSNRSRWEAEELRRWRERALADKGAADSSR
jgi:hypothetical protein